MKISFYTSVLLFLFITSNIEFISGQNEKILDLDLMTYNIRYAADKPEIHSWNNRRNGIIKSISGIDIAGLQEVLPVQVNDLTSNLPDYSITGRSREQNPEEGEGVPIIYKKDRFLLLYSGTFWLSDNPHIPGSNTWNAACNRIVTWGRFRDKQTGINFFVFNTHLDHISQHAREKSIQLILNTIRLMAPGSPVILMGDFNVEENNNVYKSIIDSGLKDTYREIKAASGSADLTYHGWQNETGLTRIDYVFVSSDFQVKNTQVIKKKENGIFPSDHFPVVTHIVLKKSE